MISACGHCGRALNLNEAQLQKIENALAALPPGKSLKFNCPHCQKPIEMRRAEKAEPVAPAPASTAAKPVAAQGRTLDPPDPPDLGWLERGDLGSGEVIEDVPQVLILVQDEQVKADMAQFFDDMGYKPILPKTAEDALERMRFTNVAAVVLHSNFEGTLQGSSVHAHMQGLSMNRRRYIFYVLVGPEFHTLYNLEALANSANLVINEKDLSAFPLVLKKGLRDYEELFGPYLAALEAMGKK
ncbi:MAG: hypothetical protein BM485_10775 [Desulfobulbaceae bacterium DB1]|nr:MAG: hypothetical protein BM485_10775 [Desulfobulbaceae bacterium DB1]